MSMASRERVALEPRRRPGRLRVAALLEAGAAVIAERGFEAATMAEIAARAGAPIGSLYRFFPNKEVLADALLRRFKNTIDDAFAAIDARARELSIAALADALFALVDELRGEIRPMAALLDAHSDWSAKRSEFRSAVRTHIARTLMACRPGHDAQSAGDIAAILLQLMKMKSQLTREAAEAENPRVLNELRTMTQLYLADRLGAG
ncbi:MAG: helix-turn-helix domain-containing protein [Roseiarcus sp.]